MFGNTIQPGFPVAAFLAAFLVVSGPPTASAQDTPNVSAPPYEPQLMRLSEIFGALHYLRPLCGEDDTPTWRDRMEEFLDAETRDENRRRRFIERFNQGYRGFSVAYQDCTDAARLAMAQYLGQGETIISDVTSRYGR
ncbi:TIGR02301 family protein [Labrenzia sp. R4_1]|uniref:TIGR02301 family protein n=1 Tax=Labrenzia sp. R4_1 TaxID=2821106 RepID=UPI00256FCEBE|nr:TIGR02301 family protein [Labrenzia sp. R4_1]